jgi:hypothetical protein
MPGFGLQILAKAELLNPGGSVKDRVALEIVQEALASARLRPGGLITEGTAGASHVVLLLLLRQFCSCGVMTVVNLMFLCYAVSGQRHCDYGIMTVVILFFLDTLDGPSSF